jgi:hypothetical protein
MSSEAVAALKGAGDVAAASVTVLTVIKVIPAVAALFAIVWYSVGLYENITGRQFSDSRLPRFLTRK